MLASRSGRTFLDIDISTDAAQRVDALLEGVLEIDDAFPAYAVRLPLPPNPMARPFVFGAELRSLRQRLRRSR